MTVNSRFHGCQVDWDTNVVIGARRFYSNEAAVSFLIECMSAIPGARIVVKTHPLDSEKKEDRLRQIIGQRGTVVSDIHPHTPIEAADCVSVRNSTPRLRGPLLPETAHPSRRCQIQHPKLTLEAGDIAEGSASLSRVLTNTCDLPDREALCKFILHAIDRYLVPVRYDYFFEPEKLDILSHFDHNQSYQALEQVLGEYLVPSTLTPMTVCSKPSRAANCTAPGNTHSVLQTRSESFGLAVLRIA